MQILIRRQSCVEKLLEHIFNLKKSKYHIKELHWLPFTQQQASVAKMLRRKGSR